MPHRYRITCQYCGCYARLEATQWGHRYICDDCQAWVGCHKDGRPKGTLANAELRQARIDAHRAFDPLWQACMRLRGWGKRRSRTTAYRWLAERLGLTVEECHIGMFDLAQCQRVVFVCQRRPNRRAS